MGDCSIKTKEQEKQGLFCPPVPAPVVCQQPRLAPVAMGDVITALRCWCR